MTEPRWLDERESKAWRGMLRMHSHLIAELARRVSSSSSLSYLDYEVLVVLTDEPEGRLRLFQLAEELGWEKSRLSHHVTRMVDRGLVTKEKCESDRRGYYVVVTDKGRTEIEAAAPQHVADVRSLFIDQLTPEQLDVISQVSETVLARLDEEAQAQASAA